MRRFIADLPDLRTRFRPHRKCQPKVLLDRHPDGRHVALQVQDVMARFEQVGVWDLVSGDLLWAPDDAILLAWADAGRQVLALTSEYRPGPSHPPILASPLQSEFTHRLDRWSWPERRLLGSCEVRFPTGGAMELAGSPAGGLATVTWLEQDCAGFVLVQLGQEGGDFQLGAAGEFEAYFTKPNLLQGPVFSPDGRYAVAACSRRSWWAPGGNFETPSPGGRIKAGHVAVLDTRALNVTEREVVTEVPAGWLPQHSPLVDNEVMGEPEFTGPRTCRIVLPTGAIESFELPDG